MKLSAIVSRILKKSFHLKVMQLYDEMFADKGAEERKRQREIDQEVRRRREEAAGKED